ncbi:PKD domain-containing protein [Blastococcus sp. URHD0036]|uniref:PKD domain-containing protein n=1 Tax=Blastococcus sp. URHD0036 TaxID=1380356 RepID=UPI00069127AE|nr:PKD domain-containing protein [Blastococcus sp. URHD0036]
MTAVPVRAPRLPRRGATAALGVLLSFGLLLGGLVLPTVASADTAPAPGLPTTVAADRLPTVQVNGVVWAMVTVGNTVYATGSFTQARPAGAAAGTSQTPRGNLLAFDLTTGVLNTSFNHTLNGQGRTIVASPDGSRVYVGGDFTTVDGVARGHVAAFSTATGALVTGFAPTSNRPILALAATATTVYAGGDFTTAGGQTRTRLAAFSASTGALTAWAPSADNTVRGIVLSPDGTRINIAGQFSTLNGQSSIALGNVDLAGGDLRPWTLGVTNFGDAGGIWNARSDGRYLFVVVYGFQVGNLEGTVALDPNTLALVWMNDCHGDPYDVYSTGTVVYTAGHAHDCETSGSYPDQSPTVWKRVIANTIEPTGTLLPTTKTPRYTSWTGRPRPTVLNFFPTLNAGTYTGQSQAAWSLTGRGDYLVMGGEFTTVNGVGQQSLVRMASSTVAPNDRGPELTAAQMRPTASSTTAGEVTVSWPSSWDMDNEDLTYRVYRNSETSPVHTVTAASQWWRMPLLTFTDAGLAPGTSASYRVTVSDAFGNVVSSPQGNAVTVATATSAYANQVRADGPTAYWRLGETTGSTAYSAVGTTTLTEGAGISRGAAGAVAGDPAVTANGTTTGIAATSTTVTAPPANDLTVEAWVRTTSTAGGVVAQFGDSASGANTVSDRGLYVDSGGRISFGVTRQSGGATPTTTYTAVRSPAAVTDGTWHHVVATIGTGGARLYVDGASVATNSALTTANTRLGTGYWMLGRGTLTGWQNAPASGNLAGSIDEVAVYPFALTPAQVAQHYGLATGGAVNASPTASFTATAAQLAVTVDGSASSDSDGTVAGHSWNWGDGTAAGSGATATHTYAAAGTYTVTLTVTDDDGATATTTRTVQVAAAPANAAPTASFTATAAQLTVTVDGSASSDSDGTVAGHSWNWGDATAAGSGATAAHTYAAAGTYTVTLTVTDDDGATATTTRTVTVSPPPPPAGTAFAADAFGRTATGGLGTADVGGAWTVSAGATRQSVAPGTATLTVGPANNTGSYLGAVSQGSADVTATVSLGAAPSGSGLSLYLIGRRTGAGSEYDLRARFLADGSVRLGVVRISGGTEALIGAEATLPGTYTPGTALTLRLRVSGSGTTTLEARAWTGTTEPATWTVSRTDTTAALQGPGAVGVTAYLSSSATAAVPVRLTAFTARPVA